MTNDVRERMQETARTVQTMLPPNTGFILMAFDFGGPGGRMEYISNANREDVVQVLKEFIRKTEKSWMKHASDVSGLPGVE